jgi:hypothetical protein
MSLYTLGVLCASPVYAWPRVLVMKCPKCLCFITTFCGSETNPHTVHAACVSHFIATFLRHLSCLPVCVCVAGVQAAMRTQMCPLLLYNKCPCARALVHGRACMIQAGRHTTLSPHVHREYRRECVAFIPHVPNSKTRTSLHCHAHSYSLVCVLSPSRFVHSIRGAHFWQ